MRKRLSKERIQVTMTVTGGQFLHLVDIAGGPDAVDGWLHAQISGLMRGLTGVPWGAPYEIPIPDTEPPPVLGKRTKMKLNRGEREVK